MHEVSGPDKLDKKFCNLCVLWSISLDKRFVLCKRVCLLTVSNVHRAAHSYFSEGVHSNKETKITETLKKLSRIFFNMTIYSYNRLTSEISNSPITNLICLWLKFVRCNMCVIFKKFRIIFHCAAVCHTAGPAGLPGPARVPLDWTAQKFCASERARPPSVCPGLPNALFSFQ